MLNRYALWKYLLIVIILVIGSIYALPNLYGSDPALQITAGRNAEVDTSTQSKVSKILESEDISIRRMVLDKSGLLVRFDSVGDQLKASSLIRQQLGSDYIAALNLASASPQWLNSINAMPMYLGLDLRGGLHFLMEVDTDTVINQALESYVNDFRALLRKNKIRYLAITQKSESIQLKFRKAEVRDEAVSVIKSEFREMLLDEEEQDGAFLILVNMSDAKKIELKKAAVKQNVTTLRNRVNEIGVAEPVIQQQGDDRIVVQLPGIQDSARAKEILSATATLEYRLVDVEHNVMEAVNGRSFPGSRLYRERDGQPILLKKRLIITGERITGASSGFDQDTGSPAVFVNLDGAGARIMAKTTQENLKKPMAVVYIEHKTETRLVDGKEVVTTRKIEEVISVATIQSVFSKRFQTTGLDSAKESQNLALLLRAGALAAPIRIVEERTIGPSLGQDNIDTVPSQLSLVCCSWWPSWWSGIAALAWWPTWHLRLTWC